MNPFKVGDKVRFISENSKNSGFFNYGLTGLTILEVGLYDEYDGDCVVSESEGSDEWGVDSNELELDLPEDSPSKTILPSNELLSAILGKHVGWSEYNPHFSNTIRYYRHYPFPQMPNIINIYELQNLMIEWAYTLGYEIKPYKRLGNFKEKGLYTCIVNTMDKRVFDAERITKTGPEAVTSTCEWIRNNKEV